MSESMRDMQQQHGWRPGGTIVVPLPPNGMMYELADSPSGPWRPLFRGFVQRRYVRLVPVVEAAPDAGR